MNTDLLSTSEACEALGTDGQPLHRSTLTRYVQMGRLKAVHKMKGATGAYLFEPAEIDRFKAERETAA